MRVTTNGYAMLFFSELIFMFFTLAASIYLTVPRATPAQNLQSALTLVSDTHTHTHTHTHTRTRTHARTHARTHPHTQPSPLLPPSSPARCCPGATVAAHVPLPGSQTRSLETGAGSTKRGPSSGP